MNQQLNSKYYGPFFWLSLTTFFVPFVVAFAIFQAISSHEEYVMQPDASGVDHGIWDMLLKRHVSSGKVDYVGMSNDPWFPIYVKQIGQAEPENLGSDAQRLALLLNAYNALTIDGVIHHKVQDSVLDIENEGVGFFDLNEHIFAGQTVSLNEIENELIRKPFQDPRIHTALVCAALGCPSIRREAYVGEKLVAQLDDQTSQFANDPKHVSYDPETGTFRFNSILSWYEVDWQGAGGVPAWLERFVEDETMQTRLAQATLGQLPIEYNEYDWTVNSQTKLTWEAGQGAPGGGGAKASEFGSGSVPNG